MVGRGRGGVPIWGGAGGDGGGGGDGGVEKNAFPISRKNFFSPGDVKINLTVIPRDSRSVTPSLLIFQSSADQYSESFDSF